MIPVGCISVSSADPILTDLVSDHLDRWLIANSWKSSVLILKNSSLAKTADADIEVVFAPGEYQSNPAKLLKLSRVPDLKSLESDLHEWLCSIQS